VLRILLPTPGGYRVTDFLTWWADHWPILIVVLFPGYHWELAWRLWRWVRNKPYFDTALKTIRYRRERKGGGE